MIEVDGSFLEGGGQILRTSLSLSALLQEPFRIENIRKGRKNPGLQPQHLTAVLAMQELCGAKALGAQLHSTELEFTPESRARQGNHSFNVSDVKASAGSVTLLFQTAFIPLACAGGGKLSLQGGTHVAWSPSFDYLKEAFLPAANRFGLQASISSPRYGYYPAGGGKIEAQVSNANELKAASFSERGGLRELVVRAVVSNLPEPIAVRLKDAALKLLVDVACAKNAETISVPSPGQGAFACIIARYENVTECFCSVGERGKPAERVASEAVDAFKKFDSGNACIDEHLSDQLLLPAALAKGKTSYSVPSFSDHLKSNAYAIRQFLPQAGISFEESGGKNRVFVEGAGLVF